MTLLVLVLIAIIVLLLGALDRVAGFILDLIMGQTR